ncbi:MAG: beta-ketoacyl-[acyl-carrier-protein] synthase family protein [Candidatus Cloacimonetes bacterium]|nr:beta-ketoacyl-[acyl-carrier-protein] synthase family protein [Candidatus Cloacimonadota bacterium]
MHRRVVITGIGPVTIAGIGAAELFANLLNGIDVAREIEIDLPYKNRSSFYVPLPEVEISHYGIARYYKFLQPEDKMAIIGAKLALQDAGIEQAGDEQAFADIEDACIVLGTGFSGLEPAFFSYLSHLGHEYTARATNRKVNFNRMVIPMLMPSSPAAWISILLGVKGESYTLNTACASGTFAIGEAFRKIRFGLADMAITGGVENLHDENYAIFRGFDSLGALTRSSQGQAFSQDRSGFLFAEGGCCVLVLEELGRAKRRNARIYAEVLDYQANSDAHHIVKMEPDGKQVTALLGSFASRHKIDYLNSHGTGTIPNDKIEAQSIQDVFGAMSAQPFINSTKAVLGHTIGASGAIEAAVTALSIFNGKIHPNRISNPMVNLNLATRIIEQPLDRALSVSYGFGGHNAGILLGKLDE